MITDTTFPNPGRQVEMRASDAHEFRANGKLHNKLRLTQTRTGICLRTLSEMRTVPEQRKF